MILRILDIVVDALLAIAIAIVIASMLSRPAAAVTCAASRGDHHHHWSYRLIGGRACWYRGYPGLSKARLSWAAHGHAVRVKARHTTAVRGLRAARLGKTRLGQPVLGWARNGVALPGAAEQSAARHRSPELGDALPDPALLGEDACTFDARWSALWVRR